MNRRGHVVPQVHLRDRARRTEDLHARLREAPPPEPEPEEPLEEDGALVCVRCCTPPVQVAWNQAEGRLVHVSVIGKDTGSGSPRICGGQVVAKGEEWRCAFVPGLVVPAFHTGAANKAHLVRLGRPAATGGPSWTGTALCGKTNSGRNRLWRPLMPAAAAQAQLCPECKEVQTQESATSPAPTF